MNGQRKCSTHTQWSSTRSLKNKTSFAMNEPRWLMWPKPGSQVQVPPGPTYSWYIKQNWDLEVCDRWVGSGRAGRTWSKDWKLWRSEVREHQLLSLLRIFPCYRQRSVNQSTCTVDSTEPLGNAHATHLLQRTYEALKLNPPSHLAQVGGFLCALHSL